MTEYSSLGESQDIEQARQFLALLDREETVFSFHCYDPEKKQPPKANIVGTIGECWGELCQHNNDGYGVYVTVNAVQGDRNKPNVVRVRAVFQEDDDHFNGDLPLEPAIVVITSPGKYHRYFTTTKTVDDQIRQDFDAVMRCMVEKYGSDKNAKDISRVLRVPGFFNTKPDLSKPHLVKVINGTESRISWDAIVKAFKPSPRREPKQTYTESSADLNEALEALDAIPSDIDRDTWRNIGTALKEGFGDAAMAPWICWSKTSANPKHDDSVEQLEKQWDSLAVSAGVNLRTLFHHAKDAGWVNSNNANNANTCKAENLQTSNKLGQNANNIAATVRAYVMEHDSDVLLSTIYQHLGYTKDNDKTAARVAILEMVKKGILEKHQMIRGTYQRCDIEEEEMDFSEDLKPDVPLPLPFDLHNYSRVLQGNAIIVFGAFNAGKTSFLFDVLDQVCKDSVVNSIACALDRQAMSQKIIKYINSEMEVPEIQDRLLKMGNRDRILKHTKFVRRNHLWHKSVEPDGINVIDFISLSDEFYRIGGILDEIADQLTTGVAIVALQKKRGESSPRGGDFALQRCRLAIDLDLNDPYGCTAKVVKLKIPVEGARRIQGWERDYSIDKDDLGIRSLCSWKMMDGKERKSQNERYKKELNQGNPAR